MDQSLQWQRAADGTWHAEGSQVDYVIRPDPGAKTQFHLTGKPRQGPRQEKAFHGTFDDLRAAARQAASLEQSRTPS